MSADVGEEHRIHPNSLMNLRPAWQPGVSPNPGGVRKGTVFVSECYKRLMSLPLEQLEAFVPSNAAEVAALKQVRATMDAPSLVALPSLREITDRTEGRAKQVIEHANNLEAERIVIRLQERFLARTGIELTRGEAIARLAELDPALAAQLTDGSS